MPRTGTGRIYQQKGASTWWIDYSFRGKRVRESSGSTKKADAVALLRKRMAEMGNGQLVGPRAEKITFEDLAKGIRDDYKANGRRSTHALEAGLKHLTAEFGSYRALDITTDRVRSYIARRQDAGAANATIQAELAYLKRAFNLAVEAGILPNKPHIPSVKVNNARKGFLEGEALERVISELPADVQPVVRFAALTGWRKSEVLSLTWSQIDFNAQEVRLWNSKNDEPRVFPFGNYEPLKSLLEEQRERTRAIEVATDTIIPYVFHRRGRKIESYRGAWDTAVKRAGVGDVIPHDLRRSAVRNLERAGVPRSVAMKLTGHKTEAVYRRYAIVDSAALSEGVGKLAKLHQSAPEPSKVVSINR